MFPQLDVPTKELFNKDNVDLRSFPYKAEYWPGSGKVPDVVAWCRKNVGGKSVKWTMVLYRYRLGSRTTFTYDWRFKRKEDLVLFKLRWL